MASVVALAVGDPPAVWDDLGFSVRDGACQIGSVRLDLVGPAEGGGIVSWTLSGVALDDRGGLDGLSTSVVAALPVDERSHLNGVMAIDHVVVSTPDLKRTVSAFDDAGLLLRRRRDAGVSDGVAMQQAFFRLGEVIVEVVGPAARSSPDGPGPARFFGLAFTVADLGATAARLGDRLGPAKDAVQPGRMIATLAREAGSSVALAFMSPEPGR